MCDDAKMKDALYDKSYICPLCEKAFKSKAIKYGKNQLLTVEEDLYAHYTLIDPLLYDVIVCPSCGYSVSTKYLAPLMPKQKEWLGEHFKKGTGSAMYSDYTTLEEAIHKHKMALLACITRKGKVSEQAYLTLHIAWLYRELGDKTQEITFLERSYQGFVEAYFDESFPIAGMDEATTIYLIAILAYKTDNLDASKQYLSRLMTITTCPVRIKERAHELKRKLY